MSPTCHTFKWSMAHPRTRHVTRELCTHVPPAHATGLHTITWVSHVTHINVTHVKKSCSCHTHEWVISQLWERLVTQMNASWHVRGLFVSTHIHGRVRSLIWMRHLTGVDRVILCGWNLRHISYMNVKRLTREGVMLHTWMSHVTHMVVSRHVCECTMSQIRTSHISHKWMGQVTAMGCLQLVGSIKL